MKLERAVLREISMRLREPFRTSRGEMKARRVILVALHSEGLEAWAECVAGVDTSSSESVDGAWEELSRLLPGVAGRELATAAAVPMETGAHPMAHAALEMALWDLAAKAEGVSLSAKLGGRHRSVPVGVSVGLQPSDAALAEVVARHLADGYSRVKVKIEPGRDVEMIGRLRSILPGATLWADANAAYTLADLPRLKELDTFELGLLEQPLAVDDFGGHAELREHLTTPICLDESIRSEDDVHRALRARSCSAINLKPGRLGGHAASVRLHDILVGANMPLWCGGMLESGIGRAHNVALASLRGFTLPGDISASRRYWERDIVTPEFAVVDGAMRVPDGPGIGVDVDLEYVKSVTEREAVFPV